jgi:hypothetical protein
MGWECHLRRMCRYVTSPLRESARWVAAWRPFFSRKLSSPCVSESEVHVISHRMFFSTLME